MVAGSMCDGLGVVEPVDNASNSTCINTTGNPISLKKGTVVGSCHAVCYVKKEETGIPSGWGSLLLPHLDDLYNNSTKDLDSEQRRMFMELLLEFQDVFSSTPNDLGRTSVTTFPN